MTHVKVGILRRSQDAVGAEEGQKVDDDCQCQGHVSIIDECGYHEHHEDE